MDHYRDVSPLGTVLKGYCRAHRVLPVLCLTDNTIMEARSEEWAEIRKKCIMLENGFWDMAISLS
jgi:hypothetical protein